MFLPFSFAPGMLCPGEIPTKGHKDDKGPEASVLGGKAKRTEALQSREERIWGFICIDVYKYTKGEHREDRAWLFSVMPRDRTRGNVHKLKDSRLCLNIKKQLFTVQVTEHWCRLPTLSRLPCRWVGPGGILRSLPIPSIL